MYLEVHRIEGVRIFDHPNIIAMHGYVSKYVGVLAVYSHDKLTFGKQISEDEMYYWKKIYKVKDEL